VGGGAQLLLAVAVAVLVWPAGGATRAIALVALAITAAQAAFLAGAIASFGRALDFVPRPLPPDLARRFGLLHGAYVSGEMAKLLVLASLSFLLMRRPAA
jgi:hypothetical protein